jgi:hypothetical protein
MPSDKRLIKLTEETGELAEAYLVHAGDKANKKGWSDPRLQVLEESVDVVFSGIDIAAANGFTVYEFLDMVRLKLDKWNGVIDNRKGEDK